MIQSEDDKATFTTSHGPCVDAEAQSPLPACTGCDTGACFTKPDLSRHRIQAAHVSGGNRTFSSGLPFPGTENVVFDETCNRVVIHDSLASHELLFPSNCVMMSPGDVSMRFDCIVSNTLQQFLTPLLYCQPHVWAHQATLRCLSQVAFFLVL